MFNFSSFNCLRAFSESLKKQVKQNVQVAFEVEKLRSSQFSETAVLPDLDDDVVVNEERPQPSMFKGSLKHYQLKGMNWLANLYDQVSFVYLPNLDDATIVTHNTCSVFRASTVF